MNKLICCFTIFLLSCNRIIPIRGTYPNAAATAIINRPQQELWDKMLDLIVEPGLPVKMIDHTSGLIVSDYITMTAEASFERKNGEPIDPNAYIAMERYSQDYPDESSKLEVKAMWNLRLTKLTDSTTKVQTKLYHVLIGQGILQGTSTGVFEKTLIEVLMNEKP